MRADPEKRLRQLAEKELGFLIADTEWGDLAEVGLIGDALDDLGRGVEEAWCVATICGEILRRRKTYGLPREGRHRPVVEPWLKTVTYADRGSRIADRSYLPAALSWLLAQRASAQEEVCAFREESLPGGLLALEEVEGWLRNEASPHGGDGQDPAKDENRGPKDMSGRRQARGAPQQPGSADDPHLQLSVVKFRNPGRGTAEEVPVGSPSLERLGRASAQVAECCAWEEADATVFVLTGALPRWSRLEVTETHLSGNPLASQITLVVHPSVTAREVAQAYRETRKSFAEMARRLPTEKHLLLFLYCTQCLAAGAGWEDVLLGWNENHGDDFARARYSQLSNFRRDYHRVKKKLEAYLPQPPSELFFSL